MGADALYRCKTEEQSVAEVQDHACRMANLAAREEKRLIDDTRQILITLAQFIRYDRSYLARCSAFFAALDREQLNRLEFDAEKQLPKAVTLTMGFWFCA